MKIKIDFSSYESLSGTSRCLGAQRCKGPGPLLSCSYSVSQGKAAASVPECEQQEEVYLSLKTFPSCEFCFVLASAYGPSVIPAAPSSLNSSEYFIHQFLNTCVNMSPLAVWGRTGVKPSPSLSSGHLSPCFTHTFSL